MASLGPFSRAPVGHGHPSFLYVGDIWWDLILHSYSIQIANSHAHICISDDAHLHCDKQCINTITWYSYHYWPLCLCQLYSNQPSCYIVDCLQAMVGQYFLWYQWLLLIPDRVYRKTISNLGLKKQQSHVQKVLFLLVESGVLFLGLQVSCWFCFHACVNYATVKWLIML